MFNYDNLRGEITSWTTLGSRRLAGANSTMITFLMYIKENSVNLADSGKMDWDSCVYRMHAEDIREIIIIIGFI